MPHAVRLSSLSPASTLQWSVARLLAVEVASGLLQLAAFYALSMFGLNVFLANGLAAIIALPLNYLGHRMLLWPAASQPAHITSLRRWMVSPASLGAAVALNLGVFAVTWVSFVDMAAASFGVVAMILVRVLAVRGQQLELAGAAPAGLGLARAIARAAEQPLVLWERIALVAPLALVMGFTAVALLPELRLPLPNLNDDAFHFLLASRADDALRDGASVLDHWSPTLELGFPQFLYYQHLPHLAAVLLHRLLLEQLDLFLLFNLVRYALLVGFPITVYWSLRKIGFAPAGAATAALIAPLFSENFRYGFAYDSYLWRGHGMYTQLWAMHLSLITLALVHHSMQRGKGYAWAVLAWSALVMSHLVYTYMMAITVGILLAAGFNRATFRAHLTRLVAMGAATGVITSYFLVPFVLSKQYVNASPFLQQWKYDSFGADAILGWITTGDLWDHGRVPVITVLVAIGVVAALLRRTRTNTFALAMFGVWLLLYFGRPTWGRLIELLPLHDDLIMHRFIGSLDIGVLLLAGVAGETAWLLLRTARRSWQAPVFSMVLVAAASPALLERWDFYSHNTFLMTRTNAAVEGDRDAQAIVATLKGLPRGRTFAGLRTDWGPTLKVGELAFSDLLTFNQIEAVSPPYQSLSLNSDLLWYFDSQNPVHYRLFNVRYLVAPAGMQFPDFLRPIQTTSRYTLYESALHGYFEVVRSDVAFEGTQAEYHVASRYWLLRTPLPAGGNHPRVDVGTGNYPATMSPIPLARAEQVLATLPATNEAAGTIVSAQASPDAHEARVRLSSPATVMLKVTYHPNWRAWVDGQPAQTFMVMPSYIGVSVPAGEHEVRLQYQPQPLKLWLFYGGILMLAAVAIGSYIGRRRQVFTGSHPR
jgi:putative flippase GtrA